MAAPAPPTPSLPLPATRQITHGSKFHWFGYYDKLEFDAGSRYVLANEVDSEGRSPTADDVIKIGMVDLQDHDRCIELSQSRAWSWQEGCMLQWVPGKATTVIWNDREGDRFVARLYDFRTKQTRTLPLTIHALSPDGQTAITADFRRIQNHRPGYGYAGLPDPTARELAPAQSGIWLMDLSTGKNAWWF